jgi:hypothetical protein
MDVMLAGRRIRLDPAKSVGKGGEADVYQISGDRAVKIFKAPTHPDFLASPHEQAAAKLRINEHQHKLPAFPKNLPSRVVVPEDLATNVSGSQIVGYSMRLVQPSEVLLRYSDKVFRSQGVSNGDVSDILLDLRRTVEDLHNRSVVIGDFNNLNVLVQNNQAFVIDADSFQFGKFYATVFTDRYLDPLLANAKTSDLTLTRPYEPGSDWYAFAVMLMECLLFVGPYGGIHTPKDPKQKLGFTQRVFKRLTVFSPEVRYPKPALHYSLLPDQLLQSFHEMFEKDKREPVDEQLLLLTWVTCKTCGTQHARNVCPVCRFAAMPVKTKIAVRGKVSSETIFRTDGAILEATLEDGELKWLYHDTQSFRREDQSLVLSSALSPEWRFAIKGESTYFGAGGNLIEFRQGKVGQRRAIDTVDRVPSFQANDQELYWISGGRLYKQGPIADEIVGDVLENQTRFWMGSKFGLGFYRAGEVNVSFVFHLQVRGLNDSVKLPRILGQITNADCVFSGNYAWLLLSTAYRGKNKNSCYLIDQTGKLLAETSDDTGQVEWLQYVFGKCAVGNFLLSATDSGIVRIEADQGKLVVTKEFPDTEPFVDSHTKLYAGKKGLYAVGKNEVSMLKIS